MKKKSEGLELSPRQNKLIIQVKNELNIDLNDYRNDDLINQILNLISFHVYFFSAFILPFFILLLLLLSTFWIFNLLWYTKLLVLILGSFWMICFTITLGIHRFFNRVKKDFIMIVNNICDLLVTINLNVSNNIQFKENKSEKMLLLFEGFLFSVLTPSINEKIKKNNRYFSKYFVKIIEKIFQLIFTSLKKSFSSSQVKTDGLLNSFDEKVKNASAKLSENIVSVKNNAKSIVTTSVKIISYPIAIINIIQIILLFFSFWLLSI